MAAAFALALAGCGDDGAASRDGGSGDGSPYKIGLLVALTGPGASLGEHEREGAETAMKAINEAGGVNGRKLELLVRDEEGNPTTAVSSFNELAGDESILGIFGATYGSSTLAFKPLLDRAEIPVIAPNSTYSVTHPGNRWLFASAMPAEVQVSAVADMLTKAGLEKAAILSTTDAIGTDGAELLKKSGLTIVGAEEMEVAASDVTTQLAKLRAKQPEALVVWGSTPNTGIAVKNAGQLGMNVPIVSGNAGASPENAKVAAGSSALERWISVGVVDPDKPLSRQEDGVERLLADHPGSEPDIYSALGYDGIMLFAETLKHAGEAADRDSVRTGIEAISGFETLAGIYTYGADKHEGLDVDSIIWLHATPDGYDRVDDPLTVLKQ